MSEALRSDRKTIRLDNIVRARLKIWPQRPPGATSSVGASWLRARPSEGEPVAQPYLKGNRCLAPTLRLRPLIVPFAPLA